MLTRKKAVLLIGETMPMIKMLTICTNAAMNSSAPRKASVQPQADDITIIANDISYSIASTEITLPSGNKIYHGYFNDKTVISDGKLYHIESLVIPPQQPRAAMFLGIWGCSRMR